MEETASVRRIWEALGLPGIVDVHTHFMPKQVMDKVWQYFDSAGPLVTELLVEGGFAVDGVVTVAADEVEIRNALNTAVIGGVDLVISVGGTGVTPRDVTPDATEDVLDHEIRGIAEALAHLDAMPHLLLDELRGEALRLAMQALGRLTGRVGVEDLLDTVFNQFCIGK